MTEQHNLGSETLLATSERSILTLFEVIVSHSSALSDRVWVPRDCLFNYMNIYREVERVREAPLAAKKRQTSGRRLHVVARVQHDARGTRGKGIGERQLNDPVHGVCLGQVVVPRRQCVAKLTLKEQLPHWKLLLRLPLILC